MCYDKTSMAVDLCKKIYTKIAQSKDLIINPKNEIAEVIVWDELQDAYLRFKKNLDVDWDSYAKKFKNYAFAFTQDQFKCFEEVMKGHFDFTQMFKMFKKEVPLVIFLIKLAFSCQMYDLDGTSFVTSNNFASKIIDFLFNLPGRQKCLLQDFFKIKPNFLTPHLLKLVGDELFDKTYKQFAFLAFLPVFYQVLLKLGIIKIKTIEEFLPTVVALTNEYKNEYILRPWIFNFIKKLETQSTLLSQLNPV